MRKNSVRKWLHAILDLLPLFVIPIFAIYTRNENYNSNIEVQTYQGKEVELNQLAVVSNDTYTSNGVRFASQNGVYIASGTATANAYYYINIDNLTNHIYAVHGAPSGSSSTTYDITLRAYNSSTILTTDNGNGAYYVSGNTNLPQCTFVIRVINGTTVDNLKFMPQLFDLTLMFGSGNEPTLEQFNNWFTDNFYPYTEGTPYLIKNYETTTYNDTDVGSQFVYTLYNATDKYFNCTNLFNLEQIWNWVQLNLFGGNAPLMVYVVWQVIVYEFFMDLIFLLYSVFMFVIDFATNTLERFYRRSC